jgi:hypothetical protein
MSLAVIASAGCGPDELESPTAVKLKNLSNHYLTFAINTNGNKGPGKEEDFKRYIRRLPEQERNMQESEIDATFVSSRDNQPFEIIYGVPITGISGKDAPLVAHEKTGRSGRFLVGLANGKVRLVNAADLEELKNAKKKDAD